MIKNSTVKVESDGYFVSHNEIYRNNEISARAKGLHGFLRSCSPDFHISMYELYTFFQEGRDAVCKAFKELEEWGYITRHTVPIELDNGKKVRRVDYTVHAVSRISAGGLRSRMKHKQREKGPDRKKRRAKKKPESDFQETDNQGPDNQGPENQRPENPCATRSTTGEESTNKRKTKSPTENVEGRESGDSAFYSSGGARARASSEGAFKAFDGDKGTGGANSAGKVSENPENAPWAGKSYSGRERYDLPTVEHHSEIHGLFQAGEFDVIEIAMGATGDFSRGGYGHWVKWLNQHISESMRLGMPKALENVTAIFIEELCFAFADCDGGTRSMAALFSARLNKAFKVAR